MLYPVPSKGSQPEIQAHGVGAQPSLVSGLRTTSDHPKASEIAAEFDGTQYLVFAEQVASAHVYDFTRTKFIAGGKPQTQNSNWRAW